MNCASASGSGVSGSVSPASAASFWIRSHRSGALTTRRILGKPRSRRKPAVAPFAAIMKSSISIRDRLFASCSSPTTTPSCTTGRASTVWMSRAPRWCRRPFSSCAT
jgi:hypothetical protein